ncbi:hypothetical protein PHYPSEUDO_015507 [Phytophthora pseudosyringae]|uniref:Uncharacterized protein n=1 Tax=Phytophthora pseudosyringae TaxID=221518 RepID=A0A8T1W3I8_9STRA|nr:hypothetical protein PHYPSEUDO_015507 [Phytophthora pseudosyringae]
MVPIEVIISCAVAMLLLMLALKSYPKFLPQQRSQPPAPITVVEVTNLTPSYHLARPTPASKAPALSPIREESRSSSQKSRASSVRFVDTTTSLPHSPVVMTSLVSPFDDMCSPPAPLISPLPPVGLV